MYNCKSRYIRIGNLQMLLEIGLFKKKKRKRKKETKKENKRNQNCIKSGLSQTVQVRLVIRALLTMANFRCTVTLRDCLVIVLFD